MKYSEDLINFNADDNINENIIIEIIVGFLQKDLISYTQKDFINSIGTFGIKSKEGVIIKIPKDFNQDLYDYLIIFYSQTLCQINIFYDKLEYIVPVKNLRFTTIINTIPLFKINPYSMVSENTSNSDDKFFYILLNNEYNAQIIVSIKKRQILSDIQLNKINITPELKDENKNYYYQIKIPKVDYNSIILQVTNNNNSVTNISISFQHNSIIYTFSFLNQYYNSIPIDKLNPCINIYETNNINYINIVHSKDTVLNNYKILKLNATIEQVNSKNKLKIKMDSLSFYYTLIKYKYYLIINLENDTKPYITSVLSGNTNLDKLKNHIMTILEEDNIIKEVIEKEIDITIPLKSNDTNSIIIAPAVVGNNLIEYG